MHIKKRKISFNYIVFNSNDSNYNLYDEIQKILNFTLTQDRAYRKFDLSSNKFCIIESANISDDQIYHRLTFKSAIHSYRAPLLDRETINERDNPKTLNEGETQKTHFIIKYQNGDALLLAEKFRGGLAVMQLVSYLNSYKKLYEEFHELNLDYKFNFEIIAKDNIDEELENLSRVQSTSIYIDKQLLGSAALNFSERLETVQENIILDVRATRTNSIKETAKDILALFNGGERVVNKIRIKGKNSTDNDVTIDTSFIEKREYIEARLNEDTGEVDSSSIILQLNEIASSL